MTVTSGTSGSSIWAPDKTVVFHPDDTGPAEIPSAVDEKTEVPKII